MTPEERKEFDMLQSKVVDLGTRIAVQDQRYSDLLQRVVDHMAKEERDRERQEKILSDLFNLTRGVSDKVSANGDEVEKRCVEYIDKWYAKKTDVQDVDTKASRLFWVAIGVSGTISAAVAVFGVVRALSS